MARWRRTRRRLRAGETGRAPRRAQVQPAARRPSRRPSRRAGGAGDRGAEPARSSRDQLHAWAPASARPGACAARAPSSTPGTLLRVTSHSDPQRMPARTPTPSRSATERGRRPEVGRSSRSHRRADQSTRRAAMIGRASPRRARHRRRLGAATEIVLGRRVGPVGGSSHRRLRPDARAGPPDGAPRRGWRTSASRMPTPNPGFPSASTSSTRASRHVSYPTGGGVHEPARGAAPRRTAGFCLLGRRCREPWFLPLRAAAQHSRSRRRPRRTRRTFAFADPERVRGILARAGFDESSSRSCARRSRWGGGGTLTGLRFLTKASGP